MSALDVVAASNSGKIYIFSLQQFRNVSANFPNFLKYVENTTLDPLKEKIVSAWTNRVMNMCNTTTNKVEYANGRLKRYLYE